MAFVVPSPLTIAFTIAIGGAVDLAGHNGDARGRKQPHRIITLVHKSDGDEVHIAHW